MKYKLYIIFLSIFTYISNLNAQPQSLYDQSVTAVFRSLEKEHLVQKVWDTLTSLPTTGALHVIYRIVLASTVYTLAERKAILEKFIQLHTNDLTSSQKQGLDFIKTAFINRLIKRQKNIPIIKAIVNEKLNMNYETPLFKAVQIDDKALVYELIKAGAQVNVFDKFGMMPLFNVQSVDVLRVLVDSGAQINSLNKYGLSAIHYISKPALIRALIAAGIDLYDNQDSFIAPCEEGSCIITKNPLLNVFADIARQGNFEGVKILLEVRPELLNIINLYESIGEADTVLDQLESPYIPGSANRRVIIDYLISKGAKRFIELFPQGIPLDLFDIPLNELN